MHERSAMGVGVVGAGVISDEYLATLTTAPDTGVRFVADRDPARARERALKFGVPVWGTYSDLLSDLSVDLVVNLTVPQVHAEVSAEALRSGRHVWSEKPLAITLEDAHTLTALADQMGLRLGCAPDTFLGAGLQAALATLRSGAVGEPRSAFACFQYAGPDFWHPAPGFLFARGGGPVLDVGPYHLTALVQVFGPVERVTARGLVSRPVRTVVTGPRAGEQIAVEVPSHVTALYEFAHGGLADVVLSFDTPIKRMALEVSGTDGALALPDPNHFDGTSELYDIAGDLTARIPPATGGAARGTGVVDMVRSIRSGEAHRADAVLATHVLETLLATESAVRSGQTTHITSRVSPARLLPDGWNLTSGDPR